MAWRFSKAYSFFGIPCRLQIVVRFGDGNGLHMAENTDRAQIPLPPPLISLGYLVSALVLNCAVPFATPWTTALRIVGGLAVAGGFWLAGSAFLQMRNAHTTPEPHGSTTALVTDGPFRFTRNPIYLGFSSLHCCY